MKTIAFDLETIADRSIISLLPPLEPDSRLKDPEKIKASLQEKDIKRIKELAMNPATNMVCCFGWTDGANTGNIMLADETPEAHKLLMEQAWDFLSQYDHFVTFNGNAFDIPTLRMNSLKRRVRVPVKIDTRRYQISNHVDVRMILGNWETFAHGNLDFYSRIFLGETSKHDTTGKKMTGDMVQDYWDIGLHEDIAKYCMQDCECTWGIFGLIQSYIGL